MPNDNTFYVGIDVSKDTLDICLNNKSHKIMNEKEAISVFIKTEIAAPANCLVVMESTGGYERLARSTFIKTGCMIHVAHPSKVHAFAKACNHFAKTDKLDAILLCKYAKFIEPTEYGNQELDEGYKDIIALRRLAKSIESSLHGAQCRIKQVPEICVKHLQQEISLYKKQLLRIQAQIDKLIYNNADLKAKRAIMTTMIGVGKKGASALLAELPELGQVSKKQIASLVGVAPKTHQSGTSIIKKGHIAGGRFHARKALYMVALVSMRHNPAAKKRYEDLVGKGKAKKAALVALMRDAIVSLNAMIKKMQPYAI